MSHRAPTILHRDDPDQPPLVGHVKVTREDWLNHARAALVAKGLAGVKIAALAAQMQVSRSSFYWYFRDRGALLDALLEDWESRNTAPLVGLCRAPSASICEACCNFFRCFLDPALFDRELDFAVRGWARVAPEIRPRIEAADAARLDAVTAMFARHDYAPAEADARARILYFMQLGYHALEVSEPMALRMSRLEPYILGFTGRPPEPAVLAAFAAFARATAEDPA
jgi:AcrR family transcriptional regulator